MLVAKTEAAVAAVLCREPRLKPADAATLAQVVSAIMFVSMSATINAAKAVDEIVEEIAGRLQVILSSRHPGQ
jgi:hypothetical protein